MSIIEPDKPKKRKRKNDDPRARWFLVIMALLLLVVLPASLFVYVSVQPEPTPTPFYPIPTPTSVFMLDYHCNVNGNAYQVVIGGSNPLVLYSPDNRYYVEYQETGVYLFKNEVNAEPLLITADGFNFYNQMVFWSPDSRFFIFVNAAQQVMLVASDGTQRQLLENGRDMLGWSPDSRYFLVNDGTYIWLLPIEGEARQLTKFDPLAYYIQNWSPNGEYIVMIGNDPTDYDTKRMTILPTDAARPIMIQDVSVFNQYVEWSPDGKNAVIFAQSDEKQPFIRFVALDGSAVQDYAMPAGMTTAPTPVVWSTDRRTIALYLRPLSDNTPQTITLIGLDGTVMPVATIHQDELVQLRYKSSQEPDMTALHWSQDDTQFRYWSNNQFFKFDTQTQTIQLLYSPTENMGGFQTLFYVPVANRLLVYTQQTATTLVEIVSLSGETLAYFDLPSANFDDLMPYDWLTASNRVVIPFMDAAGRNLHIINMQDLWAKPLLPDDVADMGYPFWSPSGKFVAVTWSDVLDVPGQFNPNRRVYLTLMNTDTGDITTLDDDFYSVYDLVWSSDEQHLIYTVWRDSGTSIERLSLPTGIAQPIVDGENAAYIQADAAQQRITLWRKAPSSLPTVQFDQQHRPISVTPAPISTEDWWYEGYTFDGEKLFGVLLPNVKPEWSRLFPSSDGSIIIAKTMGKGFDNQALHVLDLATNSTQTVTRDLKGLGDPMWSPDNHLVMYTQWTQDRILSVHLIDRTSKPIWSQTLDGLHRFNWQKCE